MSGNEISSDKAKFSKYKASDIDAEGIAESGHYELFRNWAFASHLSKEKKFYLINLGLKRLFNDKNRDLLVKFESSLKSSTGSFLKLTWEEIFEKIKDNSDYYDTWFIDYLENKINARR